MKTEDTKITTPSPAQTEFLFAGGGEYEPISIKASSLAEATEKWEKARVAVGGSEPLSIEK